MAKLSAIFDLQDKMSRKLRTITGNAENLRRKTSKPLVFTAVDKATRVIRNIGSAAQRTFSKSYHVTVRAIDLATRPIRAMARAATSAFGLLGIAGGVGGGIIFPLKMVMDRQSITTAFEVLLGSADKAKKRIDELTDFAGKTPFTRDEIYKSSRLLETFTKGALSSGKGLEMVGNVAVGTQNDLENTSLWFGRMYDSMKSGRKIGEELSRLQEMGAMDGAARARLEKLSKTPMEFAKKWKLVEKEFSRYDGMMEKMSNNLQNLLLGTKSFFMNNVFMKWGTGMSKALIPVLDGFRQWRKANADTIKVMADSIEKYGEKAAKNFLKPIKRVGKFVGNQMKILFPREIDSNLRMRMMQDPGMREELEKLDRYRNMTFKARLQLVISNAKGAFEDWYNQHGEKELASIGDRAGRMYGGVLSGAIATILGLEAKNGNNPYAEAGVTVGKSFVEGFLKSLDPGDLASRIGSKLKQVNVDFVKGEGSGWTAGLMDLAALAALGKVMSLLRGPGKLLKGGFKGTKGLIGLFGKKNPKVPTVTPTVAPTVTSKKPKNAPSYSDLMRQAYKKEPPIPPPSKMSKLLGGFGKIGKVGKFLKGVPLLGTALGGLSLLGTSKDQMGGATGGLGGGMAGATAGAAIGSVIPGVGTAMGGLAGGILGSMGGEKVGDWIQNIDFASIGTKISDAFSSGWDSVTQTWGNVESWFNDSVWTPISNGADSAIEWISGTWGSVSSWFDDNVWTPISDAGINGINFIVGSWDIAKEGLSMAWAPVSAWFSDNVWEPVKLAGGIAWTWISTEASNTWTSITDTWTSVSTWFSDTVWTPISEAAGITWGFITGVADGTWSWISETWSTASGWFDETVWTPLSAAATTAGTWISNELEQSWNGIQEDWSVVSGWFESTIWTPISNEAQRVGIWIGDKFSESWSTASSVWSSVSGWFDSNVWGPLASGAESTLDWVSSKFNSAINWISGTWDKVKGTFNQISDRGSTITGLTPSKPKTPKNITVGNNGVTAQLHADGGRFSRAHMGIVAEAGPEWIIPTSGDKNRNLSMWAQAGQELGATLPSEQVAAVTQSSKPSSNQSSGIRDIVVQITGENHYSNDMDAEKVGNIAVRAIRKFVEEQYFTGGEMPIYE
ncbi:hypothetical protein ACQKP0_24755 [Heyndrickxia sp. NPDC080065]|uniref:hypothetical protein n=1 Tax=Heyndrickxia sp. NPDC080065 TaxID=3390568 RepID=UPI003D010C43